MKINYELKQGYIDVWNEESEQWDRYIKVDTDSVVEEKKIPEKIDQNNFEWEYVYSKSKKEIIKNLNILRLKYNEIINYLNYLKSKGE